MTITTRSRQKWRPEFDLFFKRMAMKVSIDSRQSQTVCLRWAGVCDTVWSSSVVQLPSYSVGDVSIFASPVCSHSSCLTLNETFKSSDYIISRQSRTYSPVLLSASCQLEDDNLKSGNIPFMGELWPDVRNLGSFQTLIWAELKAIKDTAKNTPRRGRTNSRGKGKDVGNIQTIVGRRRQQKTHTVNITAQIKRVYTLI